MRPLVEPGPPLAPGEAERYSRHALLPQLGAIGQRRLRNASVCVVGAGGLGSPALLYLAAAGVGRLGVVDRDAVEVSNLQRQVLHGTADVGRPKAASARDALRRLDPGVRVDVHDADLTAANARRVLAGYDVVLDGTDNFPTRYVVNDACAELGTPLVWGSVLGFDAQVSVFWSTPPQGAGVDLRDLFPEPPDPAQVPSCAVAGVLGSLCGQVGALMATEATKLLTGVGEPLLGRVLVLDALAARWTQVPLRRDPARARPPVSPRRPGPDGTARSGDVVAAASDGLVDVTALTSLLAGERPPTLVDVRTAAEVALGTIPGAIHVPLADLERGAGLGSVPRDAPVVLFCASGGRAAAALALLRAAGRPNVRHLAGGYPAWQAAAGVGRDVPGGADATPRGGAPAGAGRGRLAG